MTSITLRWCKITENAYAPIRGSKRSAGWDLFSAIDATILPGENKVINTDIQVALPIGTYGRIASRSGLAVKFGITTEGGVIDNDYRGNVGVILRNHSTKPFTVEKGNKIAQLIVTKYLNTPIKEVEYGDLEETKRGNKGFGSTGF